MAIRLSAFLSRRLLDHEHHDHICCRYLLENLEACSFKGTDADHEHESHQRRHRNLFDQT